jgi:hypothetical protein
LKRQIENSVDALHLRDSEYLAEAGVKISLILFLLKAQRPMYGINLTINMSFLFYIMKPLVTEARRLPAPRILFGTDMESMLDNRGTWKTREAFLVPATVKIWACYYISSSQNRHSKYRFGKPEME